MGDNKNTNKAAELSARIKTRLFTIPIQKGFLQLYKVWLFPGWNDLGTGWLNPRAESSREKTHAGLYPRNHPMPRPLKVFKAHIGFYEAVVAAPSQKAAAEALGGDIRIFREGIAATTSDTKAVDAALAQPGMVLKRPFGQDGDFKLDPDLPASPRMTPTQKKVMGLRKTARRHEEAARRDRKKKAADEAKKAAKAELARLKREEAELRSRRKKLQKELHQSS